MLLPTSGKNTSTRQVAKMPKRIHFPRFPQAPSRGLALYGEKVCTISLYHPRLPLSGFGGPAPKRPEGDPPAEIRHLAARKTSSSRHRVPLSPSINTRTT